VSGFVCSRGQRRKVCSECKARPATLLCDYPLKGRKAGKTCDRALCRRCAVQVQGIPEQLGFALEAIVADTVDLCPAHARAAEVK
jgi:hypothetical protein